MLKVPPPSDHYPEILDQAISALLLHGREAGLNELRSIAYPRRQIARRPQLPRALQAEVFRNDRFQCRYCGAKLIPTSIMQLVAVVYPAEFPYHPNWKGGQTHPAVVSRSAAVDHVEAGSTGGDWLARENLVTACWPCNSRKGDFSLGLLGWELLPASAEEWGGLTGQYRPLWHGAGEPNPGLHGAWMRAFGV